MAQDQPVIFLMVNFARTVSGLRIPPHSFSFHQAGLSLKPAKGMNPAAKSTIGMDKYLDLQIPLEIAGTSDYKDVIKIISESETEDNCYWNFGIEV